MAGTAHSIRMSIIWRWLSPSPWLGDQVVNTLHFGETTTANQWPVGAGPIDLHNLGITDESGSFTHTTPSGIFNVERGWAVDNTMDYDGLFKGVLTQWSAFYVATAPSMAGNVELDSVRMYPIGDLGKSVALAPMIARPQSSISPTASSQHSPGTSVVLSLYSALRTKRGRGRYYFGPLQGNFAMTADGLINSTIATTLGTAMQVWLTALRDVQTGAAGVEQHSLSPVILHRTAPFRQAAVISTVRVGDELDHQERREKKRKETYLDFAVT